MRPDFYIPEISILEKIIRPLGVYVFLLVAFRIFGKRELGAIGPFDLVVWLTISNVLQNAMIGPDNSWTGGIIGAMTMFIANWSLARLSYKFPSFERILQSQPTVLIENGRILGENLQKELLTLDDLRHALHKNQVDLDDELPNLRKVTFEPDGAITIVRRLPKERGFEKPSRKRK
jgi:uncharacterized membrane protein YcaP (DUF421 family)